MVFVKTPFSSRPVCLATQDFSDIQVWLQQQGIPFGDVTLFCNGRKLGCENASSVLQKDSTVEVVFPVLGGKGGFGSMLRMIGAQIEKTTNKEACRDLSGRRLRDINEETRLKQYVNKKAEREQVEAEKKKTKMEKLRKLVTEGESKHEFHDSKYDKDREAATERVHEAVEQAFSDAKASTSGLKRKADKEPQPSTSGTSKPKALWLGVDLTESDLESSSDEEDVPLKKAKVVAVK